MLELRVKTPPQWAEIVTGDMDGFLPDHASAEYKASGMAMSMALHYRDKPALVSAMIDLAIEELAHFREVVKIMEARGLQLARDEKDPYVNGLRSLIRKGGGNYLLDRLLVGAVIEARGAERFSLVAEGLPPGPLQAFYARIARSEEKHYTLFTGLARNYFTDTVIQERLDELLPAEANLITRLPLRARLH